MEYELVCGLETHIELSTRTKVFCGCSTAFGGEPNTRCCPVCLGLPGSLPILNRQAVEYTVLAGLALNCSISPVSHMDRKNYCYPDLPKAYQISQYDTPLCHDGHVTLSNGRIIRVERIHLEEDAGKLIHESGRTFVDYNRCGVPLIEIVTKPDFRSIEEAREYLEIIQLIMRYIRVSDCKMQEGSLRSDVNVSLRPKGSDSLGTRTEIKNMNSFSFMEKAISYEVQRQTHILESGGCVLQETLRFLPEENRTEPMRNKEDAKDYRFFPEPDLYAVTVSEKDISRLQASLPELPQSKEARYQQDFGLTREDARLLVRYQKIAEYFEKTASTLQKPKNAANFIVGAVFRRLKTETEKEAANIPVSPEKLGELLSLLECKKLSMDLAKSTLETMLDTGKGCMELLSPEDFQEISSEQLQNLCRQAIEDNPKAVKDFCSGKEKALKALLGAVMRQCRGKADASQVETILRKIIKASE